MKWYEADFFAGDDIQAIDALTGASFSWADKARDCRSMEELRLLCARDAQCDCGGRHDACCMASTYTEYGDAWLASSHSGRCGTLTVRPVRGGWEMVLAGASRGGTMISALEGAGWAVKTEVTA